MTFNIKQLGSLACASLLLLAGCSKDHEVDKSLNLSETKVVGKNAFDQWLDVNYRDAYNVDFMYRMPDNETPRQRNLSPATIENSMMMAKLVKHVWFGSYDEVASESFLRSYSPRQILLIGSRSTDKTGTDLLGTAESGLKVVLYKVNHISPTDLEALNWVYFGTMHHEFAHILHQQKKWPTEFNEVTAGDYLPGSFFNADVARMDVYAPLGFVTAYSRKQDSEDVAEVTAAIICWTDEEWARLYAAAGEAGSAKIRRKVEIMKTYMKEAFNIDTDRLRDAARRRLHEAPRLRFVEPGWESLLQSSFRSSVEVPYTPAEQTPEEGLEPSPAALAKMGCQVYLQHCGHMH